MKTFDGLEHHHTSGGNLHQIEAHLIFTWGEEPLDTVAFNQWHKKLHVYCALYLGLLEAGICDFMEVTKMIVLLLRLLQRGFSSQGTENYAQVEAQASTKN